MFEIIKGRLNDLLSRKRYEHSLGVANTAKELAILWGGNPEKAYLAGLLHDCGKELSLDEMQQILKELPLLLEERKSKELLHAKVGAIIASRDFGVEDCEILKAIEEHTIGGEEMTLLSKILYIADYISPDRNQDGVKKAHELAYLDLNQAMLFILNHTLEYLESKQFWIHPTTEMVRNKILLECNERRINGFDGKGSTISK